MKPALVLAPVALGTLAPVRKPGEKPMKPALVLAPAALDAGPVEGRVPAPPGAPAGTVF